jgi:DNA primase
MEFKMFGPGVRGPKVVRDYYHANNGMHWINVDRSHVVYLVESFLDAVRISEFGNAVALLGTNLNEAKVAELQKEFDTVHLCLDPDATMKAFKLYEKYSVFFRNFNVVTLSNDPKYLSSDELRKELGIKE